MDCKSKRVDTNEDYEAKYKKLLPPLKRHTIDLRILVTEVENWVGNEESSGEDGGKDKCLIAHIDAPITDKESKGSSTFEADLAKVAKDSKTQD